MWPYARRSARDPDDIDDLINRRCVARIRRIVCKATAAPNRLTNAKLRQAATIENIDYRAARGLDGQVGPAPGGFNQDTC
jgi:hypothetical protein